MSMIGNNDFEQNDYSVVVKSHARLVGKWRWEIYRAGRKTPIRRSEYDFATIGTASRDGRDALNVLLRQLNFIS
ncbi:MAG: hypothetical protein JNJ53_03310 [Rhizobiales bacterium]|nr:hypothetical protein [Hyphomicrobiales bacterium]